MPKEFEEQLMSIVEDRDKVSQILLLLEETQEKALSEHKKRQRQGISNARERGVRFGRPRKTPGPEFFAVTESWQRHEISIEQAAGILGMSSKTYRKLVKEMEEQETQ